MVCRTQVIAYLPSLCVVGRSGQQELPQGRHDHTTAHSMVMITLPIMAAGTKMSYTILPGTVCGASSGPVQASYPLHVSSSAVRTVLPTTSGVTDQTGPGRAVFRGSLPSASPHQTSETETSSKHHSVPLIVQRFKCASLPPFNNPAVPLGQKHLHHPRCGQHEWCSLLPMCQCPQWHTAGWSCNQVGDVNSAADGCVAGQEVPSGRVGPRVLFQSVRQPVLAWCRCAEER